MKRNGAYLQLRGTRKKIKNSRLVRLLFCQEKNPQAPYFITFLLHSYLSVTNLKYLRVYRVN